jgi:phosphoserine phosphatase
MTGPGSNEMLPSWRAGTTRETILQFLDDATSIAPADRVATFDNDGTLWCERPTYVQFDFFVDALRTAVVTNPSLAERAEYAALLGNDHATISSIGLERIALALAELFEGLEPEAFTARVRDFVERAHHATFDIPVRSTVYQPMLELIDELRCREFSVFIVTGGGTEFVRSVSHLLYGVAPEAVVGTLIEHEMTRDSAGLPVLRRTGRIHGQANEGPAKVNHIQSHLGRRPILAAGNSGGDREMLEWASASDGPSLALLIDHDDEDREFRYQSRAETFTESEPITDVGRRLGWTLVSMARDWATVFVSTDRA